MTPEIFGLITFACVGLSLYVAGRLAFRSPAPKDNPPRLWFSKSTRDKIAQFETALENAAPPILPLKNGATAELHTAADGSQYLLVQGATLSEETTARLEDFFKRGGGDLIAAGLITPVTTPTILCSECDCMMEQRGDAFLCRGCGRIAGGRMSP